MLRISASVKATCRVGHASDRETSPRPPRRGAQQLGAPAGHYDCFYFVADWHALTSDYADTSAIVASTYDMVADWIARRPRPRAEHALHPVAGARARGALSAALDDRADSVARARADLQGADGAASEKISRRSASSAILCCRRRTSSSTTRTTCRSARIRCRTWS